MGTVPVLRLLHARLKIRKYVPICEVVKILEGNLLLVQHLLLRPRALLQATRRHRPTLVGQVRHDMRNKCVGLRPLTGEWRESLEPGGRWQLLLRCSQDLIER